MPLFGSYIMTDWSGGNSRKRNRKDCIWIAYGSRTDNGPKTKSPSSRTEAVEFIRPLLEDALNNDQRVLVCFDFAYGYPENFSTALRASTELTGKGWEIVWRHLHDKVHDDIGRGRQATNRSNRFEVADELNALMMPCDAAGPFWSAYPPRTYPHIPQQQPSQPFTTKQGLFVRPLRRADECVDSKTPFCTYVTGSVGSQTLTGIPRLYDLRADSRFTTASAIWPFETGWAADSGWLGKEIGILHAEIYPSVRPPLPDQIRDRGQVCSMWEWARGLDQKDVLWRQFSLPVGIEAGSKEDKAIRSEEGWILGCRSDD